VAKRGKPKWHEVVQLVIDHIERENLSEGAPLPSDKELVELGEGKWSLQPVIRAMKELERQGWVRRQAGGITRVSGEVGLAESQMGVYTKQAGKPVDAHQFSFSYGATHTYHRKLENKVLEQNCRLPVSGPGPIFQEKEAQKALGLRGDELFYVISRLRILDGEPRVIHRCYLNPVHFPEGDFLARHDFQKESLIGAFTEAGFQIRKRDTMLRSRLPTTEEMNYLRIEATEPVLQADQMTFGIREGTNELIALEYMNACYAPGWEYFISDRSTSSVQEREQKK